MPDARPFSQILMEQRRGTLHEEISEQLAEIVKASLEHGKVGQLVISFKVKPSGEGTIQLYDDVKATIPKGDTLPSIFFADEDGNVTRQKPQEERSGLQAVDRQAVGA